MNFKVCIALLFAVSLTAQTSTGVRGTLTVNGTLDASAATASRPAVSVTSAPSGSCTIKDDQRIFSTGGVSTTYVCTPTTGTSCACTWVAATGGGGGDLTAITDGTGITSTSSTGPVPTINVNTSVIASRAQLQAGTDIFTTVSSSGTCTYVAAMTGNALTAYTNGMRVQFRANNACVASGTLNIDTLGAKNLYEPNGTTAITTVSGQDYVLIYDSSLNAAAGGFKLPTVPVITVALGITVDGGGSALTTGTKGYIVVPFACTITTWSVVGDASGSVVFDVWKNTTTPTNSNSITASAKPTLSSAQLAVAQATTGWTTAVSANDVLGFEIESAATITKATLTIGCRR